MSNSQTSVFVTVCTNCCLLSGIAVNRHLSTDPKIPHQPHCKLAETACTDRDVLGVISLFSVTGASLVPSGSLPGAPTSTGLKETQSKHTWNVTASTSLDVYQLHQHGKCL